MKFLFDSLTQIVNDEYTIKRLGKKTGNVLALPHCILRKSQTKLQIKCFKLKSHGCWKPFHGGRGNKLFECSA